MYLRYAPAYVYAQVYVSGRDETTQTNTQCKRFFSARVFFRKNIKGFGVMYLCYVPLTYTLKSTCQTVTKQHEQILNVSE